MEIRLASDLQPDSIVDGEGIRTVLWTQGCSHHCKGCHNPKTWSFDGGIVVDVELVKRELAKVKGQDGITLSGGDPWFQCLFRNCEILSRIGMECLVLYRIYLGTNYDYE